MGGSSLYSAFQPIYSLTLDRPIGFEALVRGEDSLGKHILPAVIFDPTQSLDKIMEIDEVSRLLHLLNFKKRKLKDTFLFLNLDPFLLDENLDGVNRLIENCHNIDVKPENIVIEIIEKNTENYPLVQKAVQILKKEGFLIAIDDFGAGESNFNRVWDIQPNIVKLDREIVSTIRNKDHPHSIIANLVKVLHQSSCIVLLEGIEEKIEASLAHLADIDLLQGYFLGMPSRHSLELKNLTAPFSFDADYFQTEKSVASSQVPEELELLFKQNAAACFDLSRPLVTSIKTLLDHPLVIRVYVLDAHGYQITKAENGVNAEKIIDRRFGVFSSYKHSNWSQRRYFKDAIHSPNRLQISSAYFSMIGFHMCITITLYINSGDSQFVFCCDIMTPEDAKKLNISSYSI